VAIDDHSRVAYVEVLADQLGPTCAAFLQRAVGWLQTRGIRTQRVMSDNGSGYVSRAWRVTCEALGLRHLRTRAYTPRTNGKAERFVQTLLREWAYIEAPTLFAVLQPPATAFEPGLSGSLVAAHERCVMNNVLELNS
jgi:transposase InsO family protein